MNELRTSVLYIRINLVQFYPPRNGIEQSLHTWLPRVRGIVVNSRQTENPISLFACHMVDKCLNSYSYHFESDKVGSLSYVIDILKQDIDATIHMNFMNPVIKAFQSRLQI